MIAEQMGCTLAGALDLLAVYGHGDAGALEEIDRAFKTNVTPLRAINSDTTQTQEPRSNRFLERSPGQEVTTVEDRRTKGQRMMELLGVELEIGSYPVMDDTLMLMLRIASTLVGEMDNEQVGRAAAKIRTMAQDEPEDVRRFLEQMASNLDQFVSDRREEAAGF